MRTIYRFFHRHIKTRIALQLLLDAMPLLLMCGFGAFAYNLFSYPLELEWLMHIGFWGFLIGTIPVFIGGIILRRRADAEFVCYPWCEWVSRILRIGGVLSVSMNLVVILLLIAAWISI